MRSFLLSPMTYVIMGVACLAMIAGMGELFAQTDPPSVNYQPIVNFGTIFETIRTAVGPIVVGALGLGLAIWGARYMFGIIKSMGR